MCRMLKLESSDNGVVQRYIDPINGPSLNQRTISGVGRPQVRFKNYLILSLIEGHNRWTIDQSTDLQRGFMDPVFQ